MFAATNDFSVLWVIFFGMLVVSFFWLIYMATFKSEQWGKIMEDHRTAQAAAHARRKEAAKGGVNFLMLLFKLFKK